MTLLKLVLILLAVTITGCSVISQNCGTDFACFKNAANNCAPSRINLLHDGNNVRLTIRGTDSDTCSVSLKVEELGQDIRSKYPVESQVLIGKTLNCRVNANLSNNINEIYKIPQALDRACSGPIKDLLKGPFKEIIKSELEKTFSERLK